MTEQLALLGGSPALGEIPLPRAWPYWSRPPEFSPDEKFSAWPSKSIREVESWVTEQHHAEFAVYVNSGTSALWASYFSLGLAAGDEVLVPTNTFLATVTPLFQLNLVPVLCDSDPVTGCIDLADATRRITERTRAICVTHVWGTPLDLEQLYAWAAGHGLEVVEDCSHAHGTRSRDLPVGSGATVAALSLGAAKTVSGGVGGALFTSSQEVYERALLLGLPAARCKKEVRLAKHEGLGATGLGANLRGHPLAASLALDHIRRYEDIVARKNRNIERLEQVLAGCHFLDGPPRPDHWSRGTRYGFKASCASDTECEVSAAGLVAALAAEGLPVTAAPGPLLHRRRLFRDSSAITTYAPQRVIAQPAVDPEGYPVSDEIQRRMVSFDATLLHDDADALIDATGRALDKIRARWSDLREWEKQRSA